ncbi:hypothetical protein [Allomuricauda sp. d1]|uniref:hypothetical protein n=1 Tax=Allomuricauda sp. d1 TaxID=3136725 RepID=UPI0031D07DFA
MKHIVTLIAVVFMLSCGKEGRQVTDSEDYNEYLAVADPNTTSKYFELWNTKIKPDSLQLMSFGHVASEYNRFFKSTGDITYLKKAEKALQKAVNIANINKEGYARALARNYISQHRFKEALQMAQLADSIGGGKKDTQSLLFDVHMELGNYGLAEKYLDSIKDMSSFGFLIRIAKWSDYKGDLDSTIRFMEKAKKKAESSNSKNLKLWSYTNLADYYGHAGRIDDSYRHYLKALSLDPQNAYAKKGIAWIVFSHEKNSVEALRILDAVTQSHQSPDYYLLKAEIAAFMGKENERIKNLDEFYKQASNVAYGDMYNMHNIELYLSHTQQYDRALHLASKEVENRPTPESYNALAHSYLKSGDKAKALELVEKYIVGQTFEPGILLNVAKVYKANREFEKVTALKQELMGAVYELGPSSEAEILNL